MNKTITMYELLGMIKDGKAPKKIEFDTEKYIWCEEREEYRRYPYDNNLYYSLWSDYDLTKCLNDKIIIEEKKFTKEDFIEERMELDGITREQFDERYEVKKCNCGMPFCKGFVAKNKEEKKIPEKSILDVDSDVNGSYDTVIINDVEYQISRVERYILGKINEIIDYLDYLKSKGE